LADYFLLFYTQFSSHAGTVTKVTTGTMHIGLNDDARGRYKRLKVKGLDIYIPPLTGKPWPAAVYN